MSPAKLFNFGYCS